MDANATCVLFVPVSGLPISFPVVVSELLLNESRMTQPYLFWWGVLRPTYLNPQIIQERLLNFRKSQKDLNWKSSKDTSF